MATLHIRLLGHLELSCGGNAIEPPKTKKARSLLGYLLLHRRRLHSRDVLAGQFWGDLPQARARKCLRTSLWRIRQGLGRAGQDGESPLVVEADYVGFDLGRDVWLDISEFEERVARDSKVPAPEAARVREEALALYRGPLLEECYDDWCLRERERLRQLHIGTLERQLRFLEASGDWAAATAAGERLLEIDPLRENVHRDLMRCLLLNGNRPAALRQYQSCEEILERELGIEPMAETRLLYERIQTGAVGSSPAGTPAAAAVVAEASELLDRANMTLSNLTTMFEQLELARSRLREAVNDVESTVTMR